MEKSESLPPEIKAITFNDADMVKRMIRNGRPSGKNNEGVEDGPVPLVA
jgi:hypothetical protein